MDGAPAATTRIQPGVVLRGTATASPQGLDLESCDLAHELAGPITSLDSYGTAKVQGALVEGARVEVRGTASGQAFAGTLFVKDDAQATFGAVKVGGTVMIHALSTRTNAAGQAYAALVVVGGS